jgi:phosphoglycolate phosphatase
MRIKAVIFDLDGTLASFNLDYQSLRTLVKKHLVDKGVPASILSLNESIFEMLRKTDVWAHGSAQPTKFIEEAQRETWTIAEKYELEAASRTNLLPGVLDTLKALRHMGLKVGLCTINSEKSVTYILERFGIASLFDVTISRNQVKHVKPHPEHLEAALKILGVSAAEAVVVGDSSTDMQSAKKLKAIAVGLPTGVSAVEQLTSEGADYVIKSMTDLPVLIGKLNKTETSKSLRNK